MDDDQDACESIGLILQGAVCAPIGLANGPAAGGTGLQGRMRKRMITVFVILDWRMPECRRPGDRKDRSGGGWSEVPILLLSAYDWESVEGGGSLRRELTAPPEKADFQDRASGADENYIWDKNKGTETGNAEKAVTARNCSRKKRKTCGIRILTAEDNRAEPGNHCGAPGKTAARW